MFNREDLLVDWVSAITDHKLEEQHEHLRELLVRTAALLPPSLRELMRRNKIILHPSTGRTVKYVVIYAPTYCIYFVFCSYSSNSAAQLWKRFLIYHFPTNFSYSNLCYHRTKKSTRTKVGRNKTKPKASIASADPDALLAIINENISVLDNFNMKHFNHADNDVSDSENLIQGGYQDYLNSSNDDDEPNERDDDAPMQGMPHTNNAYSQGHHYSGLSTQARGAGGGGGNVAGDSYQINEHSPRNTSSQSRAYTANSRDIRSRGSPKSANRKRGARTRRKIRTPGGRERERARGGGEDSDSGESGTVTGSIMDHNDASDEEAPPDVLIQYEMPQRKFLLFIF